MLTNAPSTLGKFETNRKDNVRSNGTLFDHFNIRNIRLWLNSRAYPYDQWKMNFVKNNYLDAYQRYVDFYKDFHNEPQTDPILDYVAFKQRPIFVLNCNRQAEPILGEDVTIKMEEQQIFHERVKPTAS